MNIRDLNRDEVLQNTLAYARQPAERDMTIIMLVEDKLEEIAKAKEVLAAAGHKVAVASNLDDALRVIETLGEQLAGIVTDLHFPQGVRNAESAKEQPCGLAIVAEAVRRGIPVAVCSNIDHHYAQYAKTVIDVLGEKHPAGSVPLVMDKKDWVRAVASLIPLLRQENVK